MIQRILYNGNIATLSAEQPRISALAIDKGRIIAAGSDDEILPLARASTIRENLNGQFVIPGLTDAHLHFEWLTRALHSVDVFEVPGKAEAVKRVREFAAHTPAGDWITGRGWVQDVWDDKAFPTAADLAPATDDHPVYLIAKSGHAAWVNHIALNLCGIDRHTADPEGGKIERDDAGNPTGLLLETAMKLVADRIPDVTVDVLADQMRKTQQLALASGLTAIHDFDNPSCFAALQVLRERGELGLRVVKQVNQAWFQDALDLGIRWNFGDEWIRFGGLKLFADGALGPRTAYMIQPYEGEPDNYGMPVIEKEAMLPLVSAASAAGLPATIHAIGDRAVRDVLDVYEAVRREEAARGIAPSQRRHRVEHVQVIHPDDIPRFKELDIIASMQPIHATSDYEMADAYWGERSQWAYNPRVQLDQGVVVAFGSDAPVDPFHPLKGIHAAVTRRRVDGSPGEAGWYPDSRLTLDEALHGFTTGPAYAAGMEHVKGRLAAGYLADLVVLDQDLYTIDPMAIIETNIIATMVGGEWRYGGS